MLQKLIYSRFSKSELKKQIELILKEKISISSNNEILKEQDFCFNFCSKTYVGDIWYLPTRNNKLFITEIDYFKG